MAPTNLCRTGKEKEKGCTISLMEQQKSNVSYHCRKNQYFSDLPEKKKMQRKMKTV